ncbi:hypothetical protein AbraIFM66951_003148 [Aspergillus brasiliensis]|uniref:BZIP domain-containing protein n=1 Tax=Aspergillus brasiliensis TaxID=319629 RepID=A0A9W5Z1I1_9EURO|nr:hypothetical protein AbraCBS73388_002470 [Aspergillus brasiliensis]GKZ50157.1 hypothetical protein AbraIFM66951_003148 [Aspergillus brasiliensis]
MAHVAYLLLGVIGRAFIPEDLARVRNNQRRCRQRKRDYVAELERELASVKDTTSREILKLQSIADSLRQENERLAAILGLRGIEYTPSRPDRQIDEENNVMNDIGSDLVPSVDPSNLGASATSPAIINFKHISYPSDDRLDIISDALAYFPGPTEDTPSREVSQLYFSPLKSSSADKFKDYLTDTSCFSIPPEAGPLSESLLLPDTQLPSTTLRTEVSEDKYEDTTVCAVALELVMNCNTKNLSILELDMRLRCGYRSARFQWEGCRVDNQVLFAVIAEIM